MDFSGWPNIFCAAGEMTSLAKRAAASAMAQFISACGFRPMSEPSDFKTSG